jgi:hypothetical protein
MKPLIFPLSLVSFLLFVYVVAVQYNFPYPFIATLFVVLPISLIWMVVRVLKDGIHSGKTFDDHFYEY